MSNTQEIRNYEKSFYRKLKEQLDSGEKLDWKSITKRELYFLNLVERVTDKEIGEMYGVSLNTCRTRRIKNNIVSTWNFEGSEIGQEIERHIWDNMRYSHKDIDMDMCYRILDAIHPEYNEVAS